ncbi:thioredoxin reductase (NADPH) [Verrucomicrobium sp. GAS474]|uniref:thioredoxin-disulfide reductase n=1 Tax=Verrucomicrobium sp. GAS474 TaxID=1882831 RepID=UPI00087B967A|nr:thioredoxin-disulfide reductase [Verrucomicrobium sp. GAS474]SDT90992.1 thioredoxin reductase (NADPH) [Verrucomicrobium sp. GAS474]
MPENLVIIGSGPAGWTAAIYAARSNMKPLLVTGQQPGGLLTTTSIVENYPGFPQGVDGNDLMAALQEQAKRFGTKVQYMSVVDQVDFSQRPFKITVDGEVIEAKTVVISTGAGHRHLGIPGEHEFENKGVTYCATCDGALPLFRDKPLVVVGGGDSACEEATYLTRFGSIVYLVHRRDTLRASKIMADRVLSNPKIKPVWNAAVEEVLGEKSVTGVRLKDTVTGESRILDCAGVFVAIGHVPNTQLFKGQIDLTEAGYVDLKAGSRTNIEGVFAAGDCADHVYRQAITAAGMGCAAAIDAERFLSRSTT